jgi:two-component system OmpR family response regulator
VRALVIEDDSSLALLLQHLLEEEGFAVDPAATAQEGESLALLYDYDVIVLDLGLPDRSGITVLQAIRREGRDTPVLVLTGESGTATTVRTLDSGADDYLTKPIVMDEFKARLRALLRRGGARRTELLSCGNLTLNRLTREARAGTTEIKVTAKELALLEYLLLHPRQVVTRTTLLDKVWDMQFDPATNVVDVNVARLRKKLADAGSTAKITARRGVGFVLAEST